LSVAADNNVGAARFDQNRGLLFGSGKSDYARACERRKLKCRPSRAAAGARTKHGLATRHMRHVPHGIEGYARGSAERARHIKRNVVRRSHQGIARQRNALCVPTSHKVPPAASGLPARSAKATAPAARECLAADMITHL